MRVLKTSVFLLALLPLGWAFYQVYLLQAGGLHQLGADPGEALVHLQGEWAIRFLMLTLLVTPIRHLSGWTDVVRLRRMLGLFAFFYASLHLIAYAVFLLELNAGALWADVVKRPYISVGFSAWLLMLPLAVTSTRAAMRRLGSRWKMLHRVIYAAGILAVLHVAWLAKASYTDAVVYGAVLLFALGIRVLKAKTALFRPEVKAAA